MFKITPFVKALSVFFGTIVGVGIFGLPYVAHKAGFFAVIVYFIAMVVVAILTHSLYGEVILGTEKKHRLPGYVEQYLGGFWKNLVFLTVSLGLLGALLAYLIVGGDFLYNFFSPFLGGPPLLYTLLFFIAGSYLILRGIKSIALIELGLLIIFFIIIALFFIKTFPFIEFSHFKVTDGKYLFLPYGVILFSLWGSSLLPEIKEILGKDKKAFKKTIWWGIIAAAIIYLLFIFIVLGASGSFTSENAMSGLARILGDKIIGLGFLFGVTTCFTSFLALGLTLKKVFWYDMGLSPFLSWLIACFLPLVLFLLGLRKFIEIIGFTGALTIGAEGIITVFLYKAFLQKKFSRSINPWYYSLVGVFGLGIILTVFYFLL